MLTQLAACSLREHNTRHNQILNRWCDVLRAVATGQVVLGDKKKSLEESGTH